jgi:HPt (histidine-containing phosphotransfer) domain-containing protein
MSDPVTPQSRLFDWNALVGKLGGDEVFVRTLLGIALRSSQELPDELRAASAQADFSALARIAHKVKGTAGDLVADSLRDRARDTEIAARASSPDAVVLGLQLADALDALLAELRAITVSS